MVTDELIERVACHLAGRPVIVRWENPPVENAVGQVVKTCNNEMIVYVSPTLTGVETRYKVFLHEIAHCKNDADFVPVSTDHQKPPNSITQTQQARQEWRQHPRETAADRQARHWLEHAEKSKFDYWRVGRSDLECRLRALLDWRE